MNQCCHCQNWFRGILEQHGRNYPHGKGGHTSAHRCRKQTNEVAQPIQAETRTKEALNQSSRNQGFGCVG
jgi:hypothetical protein